MIATDFTRRAAASALAGRVGTLDDITNAAMWLLTAAFVSGETGHVEGAPAMAEPRPAWAITIRGDGYAR
jgi:hypothetical protein